MRNGTYYVYVTYSAGNKGIRAAVSFTVVTASVLTLSQTTGAVGAEVQITGNGFGDRESIAIKYDGNKVYIESGAQTTDRDGRFQSTILIPRSTAGKHTITVVGGDSRAEAKDEFTVEPRITVTPASGAAGDYITVTGTGFGRGVNLSISFDGIKMTTNETTDMDGSFQVTFAALPRGAGSCYVEARDENDNSNRVRFTLAPAAISLSPAAGYVGIQVTVSGTGFKASSSIPIIFDNDLVKTASTDSYGRFTASFNVPFRVAGIYNIKVSDGVNTTVAIFSIIISASISPVTSVASPGHVGTELTVSGAGFTVGGIVTITYDGNQVATAIVNTNGLFSTAFKAPASAGGEHRIVATDGMNTKQLTFVMESTPPPIPVPLKPEMGIKTKTPAYFDWEDANDPSGVTYTLQIAAEKNFSKGSIVLEKTGLTKSEYTLTGGERLKSVSKENPYYWHVKAVDGASNSSQWSGTGSFYVGFTLEAQQLIYIIIGIGVVLLGLLGYWLGIRRAHH